MLPYIHCGVDLRDGLVIQRELVDLDAVADQLTHDFDLELVQLAFTDGVCFGDHWDDVHLQPDREHLHVRVSFFVKLQILFYLHSTSSQQRLSHLTVVK